MIVFKGFLTITKRNLGMVLLYIAIFLAISITIQQMLGEEDLTNFKQESLDIAVIDRDNGELAKGLTEYLGAYHNIKELPDDKSILQDRLFYRDIYYVVTIPKDFEKRCLDGDEKLSVTKVPGSTSGYYVDQQINTFLNDVRIMHTSGFSLTEAIETAQENVRNTADVTLIDADRHNRDMAGHAFMFRYMPYILLSILCYTLSTIMIAFNNPDVQKRMLCSSISNHSLNGQLVFGYAVIGLAVWMICILLPFFIYRGEFLTDPQLPYYLINSFLMTLVSLSLAFLLSTFVHKETFLSAIVNTVTLGMSFTCGVFVSLDVMGKGVKTVAHFLPVYWYEICNDLITQNSRFEPSQLTSLYTWYGIQLLFALALLGIALVARHSRAQIER